MNLILITCLLGGLLINKELISIRISSLSLNIDYIYLRIVNHWINLLFLVLVTLISLIIFLWSLYYIRTHKITLFYLSLTSFVGSMLLLTIRDSLFIIFLGWEGLGITSFVLIVFYQNWIRAKGGLLTLLTNRLGDAILLISFCGVMRTLSGEVSKLMRRTLVTLFLLLSLTKRAQWPFVSWLPAAIAAPTPVSSLVHRSTLVTAGVWLIIRFGLNYSFSIFLWGTLGTLTLLVARLSALMEVDAKKVVALSTLRQLGLMFMSLALGLPIICFFHISIHALAKANLFIVVGRLLHRSFSQQDARLIGSSTLSPFLVIRIRISLRRLIGLVFTAGFFSKEQILMGQSFLFNRFTSIAIIISIAGLTLSYCFKLFLSSLDLNIQSNFQTTSVSITQLLPIFFLRRMRIVGGFLLSYNLDLLPILIGRIEYVYWRMRIFGVSCLLSRYFWLEKSYLGFSSQSKMIDLSLRTLKRIKILTSRMESSGREVIFLFRRFTLLKIFKQRMRLVFLFSIASIVLFFF